MSLKLTSDLESGYGIKCLELIRNNTKLLDGWTLRDLKKLEKHLKFLSFHKGNIIAKRNEYVDYFAIIISGNVLMMIETEVHGKLEPGDIFGYMKFLDIEGNKSYFFDYMADGPGYVAIIREEDLKKLRKFDSNLTFMLWEVMGKKALDIINFHYTNSFMIDRVVLEPTIINFKKSLELLESCTPIQDFISKLEKRDKKYLIMYSQIIEIQPQKMIAREGTRCSYMLLVLKGKTINFLPNGEADIFGMGTFVGRREFLADSFWKCNILGNEVGYMMKFDLFDMTSACASTGQKFYSYLVNQELMQIKKEGTIEIPNDEDIRRSRPELKSSKNEKKKIEPKNEERLKILFKMIEHEFIELDINKSTTDKLKKTYEIYGIPPLHAHEIYAIKQKEIQQFQKSAQDAAELGMKVKRRKEINEGMCAFLHEKLTQQLKERSKMMGYTRKKSHSPHQGFRETQEGQREIEDDLEDVKNELNKVLYQKEEIRIENNKTKEEVKKLKAEIKNLNQNSMKMKTEINKYHLLKDLLSKGITNDENDMFGFRSNNYKGKQISLEDVLNEQMKINKRNKLEAKYAYKWLFLHNKKAKRFDGKLSLKYASKSNKKPNDGSLTGKF